MSAEPVTAWRNEPDVVLDTETGIVQPRRMRISGGLLADERRRLIAERLVETGSVSVAAIESELGVSPVTARRDLHELERRGLARRTHGGAVLPGLSGHEDSFFHRLEVGSGQKDRLAAGALKLIGAGEAVFLDSSTTSYAVARRIMQENVSCTVLTNSAPVMQLACEAESPQVDLIGVGGSLRKLTRSFVGPLALAGIEAHFADVALFSVRGVTDDGHLTDPDGLEAEIKRAMITRARRAVLMVDGTKFARPALSVIADISRVSAVLAADVPADELDRFSKAGLEVHSV
jgi:DeoR/GlpR family transcriptional regulator of sugar metabolism